MPFTIPNLSTLIARAKSDINARLSGLPGFVDARLRRSLNFVMANVNAGAANGLYGFLSFIFDQVFPDTAESEFLDRWASIWGVTRNQAGFAQGNYIFTGKMESFFSLNPQSCYNDPQFHLNENSRLSVFQTDQFYP